MIVAFMGNDGSGKSLFQKAHPLPLKYAWLYYSFVPYLRFII